MNRPSLRTVVVRGRHRQAAIVLTAILALSACGSTVQWSDSIVDDGVPSQSGNDGQIGLSPPAGANGGRDANEQRGEDRSGTLTDASDGRSGPSVDGAPNSIRSGPSVDGAPNSIRSDAGGRGFTSKIVYIGYGTEKGADDANRTLGVSSDLGNQEAQAKAAAKIVNDNGGIAGRRIELVFHDFAYPEAINNPDAAAQRACDRWTQDKPVFAAVNIPHFGDSVLRSCMAKRQTPLISGRPMARPDSVYSTHAGYLYAPTFPSIERLVRTWVARLEASGYFRGWNPDLGQPATRETRIGIFSAKGFNPREYTEALRKELGRRSYVVASTYECTCTADSFSREINNAALRFRREGVTHVISQDGSLYFFMTGADSHQFRPRYAVESGMNPNRVASHPRAGEQLPGALGIGYMPMYDVQNAHDPGDVSPSQSKCRAAMKKAGENTSNRVAASLMYRTCDMFNFLQRSVKHGGLSAGGMRKGVGAIGELPPASTFRIEFPDGRPDGAAAVRDLEYRSDCKCFQYVSPKNLGM